MKCKKSRGLSILSLILLQLFLIASSLGILNEEQDLTVSMHSTLESDSTEIFGSALMPTGTYDY